MASDPTSSRPTVLKRFTRLEMDGDPPPPPRTSKKAAPVVVRAPNAPPLPTVPRERMAGPTDDVASARELAADLTANARQSLAQTTPQARRADRAAQLRERSPWAGAPPAISLPPGTVTRTVRLETRPSATPPSARRPLPIEDDDALRTPGVIVMEVDLREERGAAPVAPGIRWETTPRARAEPGPTPIELTPMAARQVMLMAWQAGMPGSGLRILTSWTPGLGGPELDFAFDDDVQADDHVFLSHGVRLIVDPESLRHVRGRRITWHDVPGSEGFAVR